MECKRGSLGGLPLFICNRVSGLCADGLCDLDVDRGEPVVAVGFEAVDDAEELVVQGG